MLCFKKQTKNYKIYHFFGPKKELFFQSFLNFWKTVTIRNLEDLLNLQIMIAKHYLERVAFKRNL